MNRLLTSSKGLLALAAIVSLTVLASLDKLDGKEAALGILLAAGVYSGATAYEDRKRKSIPPAAVVLLGALAAPVLSGCSALTAALPVIASAAPVIETILTQVERADTLARHNLRLAGKLYPDFPRDRAEAEYVRVHATVQAAATAALEAARAAESADDENFAAAMAHLRRAYDAYMAWHRKYGSLDEQGRLRFVDGSLLTEEPVPAGSSFRVE